MTNLVSLNPFSAQRALSHASEVGSARENSEVQSAMIIAKRFPRDQVQAMDRILQACTRHGLAEGALYSYNRGGSEVTGPSIRLAEAMAQAWGNLQFGIRELEQKNGESTVEAFAWDLETNTRQVKVFQVPHVRHTKSGSKVLTDPRDIYELVANQGARRLRACILGVIPGDVSEAAQQQCEVTLAAKADTSPEAIKKLISAFAQYDVTQEMISKRIGNRVEAIRPAQMIQLRKIYSSLRDGMSAVADWFDVQKEPSLQTVDLNSRLSAETNAASEWPQANPKTSELIDSRGIPWIDGIHSSGKTCNSDGTWRRQKGISQEAAAAREAEVMHMTTPAPTTAAAGVTFDAVMRGIEMAENREQIDEWLDLSRELDLYPEGHATLHKAAEERLAIIDA